MAFFPQRNDRSSMKAHVRVIEKAAHTLMLASRRKRMTTSSQLLGTSELGLDAAQLWFDD